MYESFLDWDLKDTGLVMSLEPVSLCSKGDHLGEFDRRCKTKHTQREGLYVLRRPELGVEESVNSGAVTRISGDPNWNRLAKYMEWAAVDTLVKLTMGNVDAAHTS